MQSSDYLEDRLVMKQLQIVRLSTLPLGTFALITLSIYNCSPKFTSVFPLSLQYGALVFSQGIWDLACGSANAEHGFTLYLILQ